RRGASAISVIALRRAGTPLLWAAGVIAGSGLFAALLAGRPEPVAFAAPFLLALVGTVPRAKAPEVDARLELDKQRALEGEEVIGRLHIAVTGAHSFEVLVGHAGQVEALDPQGSLAWWVPPGHHALTVRLRAKEWGLARIGPVHVRAHSPLGLVRWQGQSDPVTALRVLPPTARLRSVLGPDEPRVTAGSHLSRQRGEGFEFAEVRQYSSGDGLRHVNWAVSSRRGGLWVNQRHPERSADVVLLVDTFAELPGAGSPALVKAVRAAWMLASRLLDLHDRVGLVSFGGYPSWVPARGGDRARYALLDRLLATQATFTEAPRRLAWLPPRALPSGALVIALTPLTDDRTHSGLVELRRRGTEVIAVAIEVSEPQPAPGPTGAAALRLWRLERERARENLQAAGVPVISGPDDVDPAVVLETLGRMRVRRALGMHT
ncbi:MAG TPA: DUF58 domain-containing protein, partial [Acidimicrobiales bacterium]